MAAMLEQLRRTRPRAMSLAMMTIKKNQSIVLLIFYGYGALLCGLSGRWDLRYKVVDSLLTGRSAQYCDQRLQ